MAQDNPVRFGIIGAGRIALEAHIPSLREAGAEIVALADPAPGRAAGMAAEHSIPHAYEDVAALLARDDIEAVTVATPTCAHAENTIQALQAGKHVCQEKPPAMNAAEIERVAEVAVGSGRLLMIGSQTVYHRSMQTLKGYIDRGELGEIYFCRAWQTRRREMPHGWYRLKAVAGGDAAIDGMSHMLDRVLYLLGSPRPVSVTARTYRKFAAHPSQAVYEDADYAEGHTSDVPVSDCEDLAAVMVQFEGGCTAVLDNARASNMRPSSGTQLFGTQAGASFDPLVIYGEDQAGQVVDTHPALDTTPESHAPMFLHFCACIRAGVETQSPVSRAVTLMRIVDAIYASEAAGGTQVMLS